MTKINQAVIYFARAVPAEELEHSIEFNTGRRVEKGKWVFQMPDDHPFFESLFAPEDPIKTHN
jgi:hypothetical protein